ncbi:MAG TPA: tetratricopeptide repeat protein, partial [Blastocatellia bacterium]|nr:tetratricopeptide repeat protein [Blastocatellia bacterium]
MSFTLRVSFCLLALSLNYISPALVQSQPAPLAPAAQHSSDEDALRALAEAVYGAWAAKDLDAFMRLWSAESSELEARRKQTQRFFADSERIEIRSLTIRAVKLDGSQARVRSEADVRVIEGGTGKEKAGDGKRLRTLECVKEADHWKVRRLVSTYDEIAAALAAAGSEPRRAALLAEERELVTAELVRALIVKQGHRFLNQQDYSQALAIYRLAHSIAEQLGDREGIAIAQNYLGTAYCWLGDDTQGFVYLQKSLASYKALGDMLQVSNRLNQIGILYWERGNYGRALEYFQRGLAHDEAMPNKRGIADKLGGIGDVYSRQGRTDQALAYFRKSLKIFEELDDKRAIAYLQINIGTIYQSQGLYEQALEWFQRSMRSFEEIQARDVVHSLKNIGDVYRLQGRYDQAMEYLRKSLRLWEEDRNRLGLSRTLNSLARLYQDQGKYQEMLEVSRRAARLAEGLNAREELWNAQERIGAALLALGQRVEARRSFLAAIATIESLRHDVAGGEQQQQSFLENKLSPWLGMIALLVSQKEYAEALSFAEQSKARVLLDALQAGSASLRGSLTPRERQKEEEQRLRLAALNSQLTSEMRRDKPDRARVDELKAGVEKVRLEYEALETSLYVAHPELKVHRGEASIIKAGELTALLPDPSSALLEYVVADDRTYLFAVTKAINQAKAEVQVYTIPIKRAELGKQAESFRAQLAGRDLGFRASAQKLYDLLVRPAQKSLRGKSSLVIVPDDKLWELPFQALLSRDGRYVIEKSAVSYAPSLTVLREMKSQRGKRRPGRQAETSGYPLLALGNPAIGKETIERAALTLRDEKLDPLPEAEQEVKAISRLYG